MNKFKILITILFFSLTSCISQKHTEETFEIKKSKDLSEDVEKYGTPDKILESTEKGYYVKTCIWNNVNGEEITCDYSSIEMRTCKRSEPIIVYTNRNEKPTHRNEKPTQVRRKTDYENDIVRFGHPNDISTYTSDGYYSKTCTWYNANGKYRSYDYNKFGKRTSTFETSPIK